MGSRSPRRIAGLNICEAARNGAAPELLAEAELRDEIDVTLLVLLEEVVEKRTALVHHHQQAAAAMVVLRVALEVLGQVVDALREDRHLDFRRSGVARTTTVFLDERILALCSNRHRLYSCL